MWVAALFEGQIGAGVGGLFYPEGIISISIRHRHCPSLLASFFAVFVASAPRSPVLLRRSGSPDEADPLLDVISNARPEGLHPRLEQPSQMELPQAELVLDPCIGEFGTCTSLLVDRLRLIGPRFLMEAATAGSSTLLTMERLGVFFAGTTLLLVRAGPAVFFRGMINEVGLPGVLILFSYPFANPGRSFIGFVRPSDDQRALVLNDPFDRLPFLDLQGLGEGGGADKEKLTLLIAASQDNLHLRSISHGTSLIFMKTIIS